VISDLHPKIAPFPKLEILKMVLPHDPDLLTLLRNMQQCSNFGICKDATYDPAKGHIPRGFAGAEGKLEDVLLVMVFAEPGFPLPGETYSDVPEENLRSILKATHWRRGTDPFHRNVTRFLDAVFPSMVGNIEKQLRKVWMTQTRHCSLAQEIGSILKRERMICSQKHLLKQVELFPNAKVLLAGGKAKQMEYLFLEPIKCGAFAPPGCNQSAVRQSHVDAAATLRAYVEDFI
jgi:hypothetical protein